MFKIVAKIFKILTLKFIFPYVYNKAAKAPVDENKVVFVEVRLPNVTNSFKVIFDELVSKYDFNVHTHFLRNNAERRNIYLRRCIDMLKDIATAKYVFLNEASNCIGSVNLRPETKITQLWHGCGAFKKFGLSTAELIFGDSRKEQLKHPYYKNYSLVTVSSPEVSWAYEEAMNLSDNKEIIKATGSSRTDVFYDEEFIKSAYENLYDIVPQAKGKKIILYAPTFRGRVANAQTSRMFNIKMFYDNLGDDYFILFKHHPLAKRLPVVPNEFRNFAMDVTKIMDIEDLLCVSDICITDYSSLVFEYSLFEKPIIFFAYDLDTYFDWRGFYYDYYEMSPGPVCTTNLEMIDYIKNLDTRFDKQRVKDFRYKFMRSCDGKSTQRILDTIVGEDVLAKHRKDNDEIKPYNLVPNSTKLYRTYLEEIDVRKKYKKCFRMEYEKYVTEDIKIGKVVLLDCCKEINRVIKAQCKDAITLKTKKLFSSKNYVNVIKELATAEYIFIDKDNELLNMLSLKDDTSVVFIPKNPFPFTAFGKSTLEYQSGVYSELHKVVPPFNKVDIVAVGSEAFADIYSEALSVDKSKIVYFGDILTDCFSDAKYKQKAMEKINELCGDLGGKKILLEFVAREDERIPVYESEADSYLYEYLKDDYIILKYFETEINREHDNCYTPTMREYVKGMFDVTKVLTPYEAIAVADVILGSVTDNFFASFVAKKPVFAYAPFVRRRLHRLQTDFKYEAVLPCKVYTNPDELINAILDAENYDYTKLNKFNEIFIRNNDGKNAEKLITKLGLKK